MVLAQILPPATLALSGSGPLSCYMPMKEDIKNNIIILALDNLVRNYSIALDDSESTLNNEDKEAIQFIVDSAALLLGEYANKVIHPKPEWNKILPESSQGR